MNNKFLLVVGFLCTAAVFYLLVIMPIGWTIEEGECSNFCEQRDLVYDAIKNGCCCNVIAVDREILETKCYYDWRDQ